MAPEDVLAFWFGTGEAPRPEWFRKDAAFDALITERFGATIEAALRGELAAWRDTPDGRLAEVIVLDQFTRNAFRDTPRAFAGDAPALARAREMLVRGDDRTLPPLKRWFAYMPLEHAENLAAQEQSVQLFEALAADAPEHCGSAFDYALRHHQVVQRFGRFPHRNAILGRRSTPAELAFLEQPGSRF
ncbi:DUF924 family protein [Caldimonas sp. KR1-144]|uniref:DUF924 family protein n=1 Tax=Caldimonas sp. KR1-144 TaxID=3400911 RepID=UPI003BFF2B7B